MTIRWLLACLLALFCCLAPGCSRGETAKENGSKAAESETQASKDAKSDLKEVISSLQNAADFVRQTQQVPTATATSTTTQKKAGQDGGSESEPSSTDDSPNAPGVKPLKEAISNATNSLYSINPPLERLEN